MDLAYDHIQEEAYIKKPEEQGEASKEEESQNTLNNDIQEAYKAFTASPWGAKIGGFFGNVVKQGESVYNQASKELAEVREDATKGFSDLRETIVNRTRSLSLTTIIPENLTTAEGSKDADADADDNSTTPTKSRNLSAEDATGQQNSETYLSRLRTEAAKRLKDLQRAEDAADEALLQFGSNVRNFLRDAISVAPPDESQEGSTVLFESKDSQGKRVIHSSRFDAQLHVIHTSTEGFAKDPENAEYEHWGNDFDIEKKTDDIAGDLSKYPELRATMEKLVPDQIPYPDFWKRYYFLRHGIETAESRRRDLLKAASAEEQVGWGDDSDSDEEQPSKAAGKRPASVESSTTIQPPASSLKPAQARKSNDENSQADSEASYDVVGAASGAASRALNSPKEVKEPKEVKVAKDVKATKDVKPKDPKTGKKAEEESEDDSDEDDSEEEDSEEDSDDDEESDEDWE